MNMRVKTRHESVAHEPPQRANRLVRFRRASLLHRVPFERPREQEDDRDIGHENPPAQRQHSTTKRMLFVTKHVQYRKLTSWQSKKKLSDRITTRRAGWA